MAENRLPIIHDKANGFFLPIKQLTMKKTLLSALFALAATGMAVAAENVITLDLTKSTTKLEFDADNGSWTGTFVDEEESIESQVFSFVHSSMSDWDTWWGFTASNKVDNSKPTNTITYQYSNMARGGIVLDENGAVKTDQFGAPVVSADVPYLVAYYSAYMAKRPVDMTFNDGKNYQPIGMYVNLNSYAYYSIVDGDSFARAFTNNDKFTLTIHGVAPDESEKTIDVTLAEYKNGDLTTTRGWKYVDLTELGTVNELYFTMSSTDSGTYGMNTPGYFCIDKLSVSPAEDGVGTTAIDRDGVDIAYNRATKTVKVTGTDFAVIYDVAGSMVMSSNDGIFDVSSLPAGVYIVRAGNHQLKIAK